MTLKTITDIDEVRAGDVAYFRHLTCGLKVIENDREDDEKNLYVRTPKDFPFGPGNNWWPWNSAFLYAEREIPDKKLPAVTRWHPQAFFTQSGETIYYDGDLISPWNIWNAEQDVAEFYNDEELKNHLSASEFPLLNAVPGEVAE